MIAAAHARRGPFWACAGKAVDQDKTALYKF